MKKANYVDWTCSCGEHFTDRRKAWVHPQNADHVMKQTPMKAFDLEEANRMTNNQMMTEICRGLAEVCEGLAEQDSGSRRQRQAFQEYASEFRAFVRLYDKPVPKPEMRL